MRTTLIAVVTMACLAAAPSTQPTTQPDDLRRINMQLAAEVVRLKAQNAELLQRLDVVTRAMPPPVQSQPLPQAPASEPTDPISKAVARHELCKGMTLGEANLAMGFAGRRTSEHGEETRYVWQKERPDHPYRPAWEMSGTFVNGKLVDFSKMFFSE